MQGWARDGLTDEQIAKKMGISPSTLYEWEKKYAEMLEALKKGKEVVDFEVENALLQKALGGDTTAAIFWLKNRKPQSWREKPMEYTHTEVEDDPLTKSIEEAMGRAPVK